MVRAEDRELEALTRALRGLQRILSSKQVFALLSEAVGTDLPRQAIDALTALGGETMPVAEVAKRARMDLGATSRQLRDLEEGGFVTKRPSPENRSVVLVSASARGRNVARRVEGVRNQHLRSALEDWSSEDRRRLATLLDRFVLNLQETPFEADPDG